MRTQSICLALAIVLLCAFASAQWVQTNGPNGGAVRCIAPSGMALFTGTETGVYRSTDAGSGWTAVDSGLTNTDVRALVVSPGAGGASDTSLFAGTAGGIFRSTNDGTTWAPANTGIPGFPAILRIVNTFGVFGTDVLVGTRGRMYVSTDYGTSWTPLDTGLTVPPVSAFASIGSTLFAGTYAAGPYRSTDNGITWLPVTTGLPTTPVSALVVSGTTLFAGTANGVYRSTDLGSHWGPYNAGLTDTTVSAMVMADTTLFSGTRGGVFRRSSHDTSWSAVNHGLMDLDISALTVYPSPGVAGNPLVIAGTRGGTVWRRPLSEMVTSVAAPTTMLPTEPTLYQNYPNPFNPTTKIQFTIVNRQLTIVKVYDVLGRDVATLVNEVKEPGTYTVTFDARLPGRQGSYLTSGVYFYRLQVRPLDSAIGRDSKSGAGNFVQTRKLLLLR